MVPLATVPSNLGLRRLKHRSAVHQPTNALLDVLGDEPRRQASLRRTCLLVGGRDDPDDHAQIAWRHDVDGGTITQVRMWPGEHAIQIPRVRPRTLIHEHLSQLVLERHQLPVGNPLPPIAQADGQ